MLSNAGFDRDRADTPYVRLILDLRTCCEIGPALLARAIRDVWLQSLAYVHCEWIRRYDLITVYVQSNWTSSDQRSRSASSRAPRSARRATERGTVAGDVVQSGLVAKAAIRIAASSPQMPSDVGSRRASTFGCDLHQLANSFAVVRDERIAREDAFSTYIGRKRLASSRSIECGLHPGRSCQMRRTRLARRSYWQSALHAATRSSSRPSIRQ